MPLTSRWTNLKPHPEQARLILETDRFEMMKRGKSPVRFPVVPAGRRSGKTELAKRKLVIAALEGGQYGPARFFAGAPTRDQAKRIFWEDLKLLTPYEQRAGDFSESDLTISYTSHSQLVVIGMDKPERIEGPPWDGGVLDEYGNMKESAWKEHVRPALSDRKGWCWFIGVPEGRNHYYTLDKQAKADETGQWGSYHWISADILDEEEMAAAKRDLDELTYQQEYEASFISFEGRAYYAFTERYNTARIKYNPKAPLVICFDFNVEPGVAAIIQEKTRLDRNGLLIVGDTISCVIGEVYIERNSNTIFICDKIINDWGEHQGEIYVYGDATGGARGTAKIAGPDWDLVREKLDSHFGSERVHYHVPSHNPPERARINAVNSRCKSMTGIVRLLVDPGKAPHVVTDFEGVQVIKGGSGEIDKKANPKLSHISDAIGYYIVYEFPITADRSQVIPLRGL